MTEREPGLQELGALSCFGAWTLPKVPLGDVGLCCVSSFLVLFMARALCCCHPLP